MSSFSPPPEPWWVDPIVNVANGDDLLDADLLFMRQDENAVFTAIEDLEVWMIETEGITVDAAGRRASMELLESLHKHGRATGSTLSRLSDLVSEIRVDGHVQFDATTRRTIPRLMVKPTGAAQLCAFAVAALIDAGYDDRVGRCALPSCKRLFVAWKRSDQAYCRPGHGSQVRVKRSRKRAQQ